MSIADDMIDGLLCCQCGVYIGKLGEGPSYCGHCKPHNISSKKKIKCSMCKRSFNSVYSLNQHKRDSHK